jgi:hypothetical protein
VIDNSLFSGPFFDHILEQLPLRDAKYFKKGSTSMLYQCGGKLYRLTRDGGCHAFLASQTALGCSAVVEIKQDFGPVAPSDEDHAPGYYYWLAEVEWLEPLESGHPQTNRLEEALDTLEYELGYPDQLPRLIDQCDKIAMQQPEFADLFLTLAAGCRFAYPIEGDIDLNIGNIMRRPINGELVWTDPLSALYYMPESERLNRVENLRGKLEHV